jgi:crotonobetainyl-CoA:carnitine CoA-transferase CaiB-like acyl-CoA transferase
VLQQPDLPENPKFSSNVKRVENRAALDDILNTVFAAHSIDQLAVMLQTAQIAFGRLNTMDDFAAHPQNRFVTVRTTGGELQILAPGAVVNGVMAPLGAVPDLGANSTAIRDEFAQPNRS